MPEKTKARMVAVGGEVNAHRPAIVSCWGISSRTDGEARTSLVSHKLPFREKPAIQAEVHWATANRQEIVEWCMPFDEWDDHADGWDADEDVRIFAKKAFDGLSKKVLPLLPNLADGRVLDFGCGTGLLSEKLAPLCRNVVAVDTSSKMIAVLQRKIVDKGIENVTTLQSAIDSASIERHSALTEKFDLIVASSVCNFLEDYEASLRCLCSMMRPGAYFVQWDWLGDMSIDRILGAYEATGLRAIAVEEEFVMEVKDNSIPVVVGLAQSLT